MSDNNDNDITTTHRTALNLPTTLANINKAEKSSWVCPMEVGGGGLALTHGRGRRGRGYPLSVWPEPTCASAERLGGLGHFLGGGEDAGEPQGPGLTGSDPLQ